MQLRITNRWLEESIGNTMKDLPIAVATSILPEDIKELLGISMGYVNRRDTSQTKLHRKITEIATTKHSPTTSKTLASDTVYSMLVELERKLESRYRLKLHFTTHYVEDLDNGVLIYEFEIPKKAHSFSTCPLCNTIKRG